MLRVFFLALIFLNAIRTAGARRSSTISLELELDGTTFQSSRQIISIWSAEPFFGAKPIDLESHATIIEGAALRSPKCLHMTFDEAANEVATTVSSKDKVLADFQKFYSTVVTKVHATAKNCPECVNLVAATGQVFDVEHAWAIMSIVVNFVGIVQTRNPSFKTMIGKLCHLATDALANDKFFDWKACATEELQLKCVLALGVAYLNHATQKYIEGMLAVIASIATEIIVAARDIFNRGANGASLWKIFFSLSRLFVFLLVGLLKGKATGQFADALMQLGNLAVRRGAESLVASLHESFQGLELDSLSDPVYDSTLGTACTKKLSMLLYDKSVNMTDAESVRAKLIRGMEAAEDHLPFDKWTASARLNGGRVLNAYLQRSTMHDKEQWENWRWIQPRFKDLEEEDRIGKGSSPEARAMWACRLGERICTNKRKPKETQVVLPLSGNISTIETFDDIDSGWRVVMPWFHSCCISSGSCSLT